LLKAPASFSSFIWGESTLFELFIHLGVSLCPFALKVFSAFLVQLFVNVSWVNAIDRLFLRHGML
jgi:hypothetical protein